MPRPCLGDRFDEIRPSDRDLWVSPVQSRASTWGARARLKLVENVVDPLFS